MGYKTDFSGEKATSYELLPEGEHKAIVTAITPMTSKKGFPMVLFELKVGDNKLWHYCLDVPARDGKPAMRWLFKKTLEAITGVAMPHGAVEVEFEPLIGKSLTVVVGHEEYQGKTSAKVTDVILPDLVSAGQEPMFQPDQDMPF